MEEEMTSIKKDNESFECKVCHLIKDSYVEFLRHRHYTVKEWKKLCKTIHDGSKIGNDIQFVNYVTQRKESYDYITAAEIICMKYEVTITDHKTKMEKLDGILDKFSFANLDKTLTKVSRGIDSFAKTMESEKPKKRSKRTKKAEPDYSFLDSRKKSAFF